MSYESKWKDRRPTDTINAVQEFLRGKDIHVEETNTTCMGSCYAVTLVVENTNLFVNGKGSSLEFARASAYGELMERVLTKVLFRYNYYDRYSKERDTIFFEDEVLFDEAEYKNHLSELGLRNCDYHSALDVQKYFTAFSSKLVMEPFNTINGEKTKYFPVSVLDVLFGTNGMAFGNTLEEAKTQALSEVFERYCNKEIINKEIIMPQIPADGSIFKDRLLEEIVEVKEKTGLEVTIYDASLGKGYPVISVIFENKENNTYFVKFGAHFDINVATERCLTEMFQGRRNNQSDYMKEKTYLDDSLWRKKNLESILHTGDGYYPVDVVNGGISEYKFEKWPEFDSNSEALEFYTNKLLEISDEVYFKVYKENGFNVVRYLIPQVSQIYDDIAYKMRWQGELNDISNLLERTDDITENELKDCIDFISNNCSSASNTIIPFFKHRFSYNSIFKYYNLYLLKFEYYIMCGKLDSAKEIMEKYKNKSNTNKDILSAMTLLIEKIKGDSDNIKEYKMLLSNKLFKIDQLHSDDYCKCNICNCQKIKKAYDKFLIALPKGV
jgi:YcaO-like protein with predicted kinase domain